MLNEVKSAGNEMYKQNVALNMLAENETPRK